MTLEGVSFLVFFMILARVIGLFLMTPVLSDKSIPQMLKLVLGLWITLLIWLVVPPPDTIPTVPVHFLVTLGGEFFVGFIIGFISRIVFMGIQVGGALMDMQMGLSVAAAFDPAVGGQTTIMSRTLFFFATAMFLMTDTHHLVLASFYQCFRVIPLGSAVQFNGVLEQIGNLGSLMFFNALTLSMPILVIIFLLDFSLGLLARLAPQVNVFFLGFQIKPMLGLVLVMLILPVIVTKLQVIFERIAQEILLLYQGVVIIG